MVASLTNPAYPLYNDIAPSWADAIVTIVPTDTPLLRMEDIKAINTGTAVEIGMQKAPGGRMRRRTTGDKTDTASITLYHHGLLNLIRNLSASTQMRKRGNVYVFGLVIFNIDYKYTPPGSVDIFQTILFGCRITGDTLNGAEGTEANSLEIPLSLADRTHVIDSKYYSVL